MAWGTVETLVVRIEVELVAGRVGAGMHPDFGELGAGDGSADAGDAESVNLFDERCDERGGSAVRERNNVGEVRCGLRSCESVGVAVSREVVRAGEEVG